MSVFFEGEKYPTLSGLSRLITTLNAALGSNIPPPSWNLGFVFYCGLSLSCTMFKVVVIIIYIMYMYIGVNTWGELPTEVTWISRLGLKPDLILQQFYLLSLH